MLIGKKFLRKNHAAILAIMSNLALICKRHNNYEKAEELYNFCIEYTDKNAYDIISIDEAHEHNKNMDLLLTFLRDAVQLNNSLRLVIITATIDDDEPIYRRYYKYISDNLLYPLNNTLFDNNRSSRYINLKILQDVGFNLNIKNTDYFNFDRISIDRRLHISKPQGELNYKVDEYYQPNSIDTYDDAEKLGIAKAIEISKYATGEILFFSVTEPKINAIVNELNKNISGNWIALPYYSTVKSEPTPSPLSNLLGIGSTLAGIYALTRPR
jgi:hypothetical protein